MMKIAICNSQNWFNLSEDLSLKHHILMIQDRDGLTIPCLEQFEPDLIFFSTLELDSRSGDF